MSLKKSISLLKHRFHFLSLERKRGRLMASLPAKHKIKIAFLGYALGDTCDIFSNLYYKFAADDRFDPYMVIVPNNHGDENEMQVLLDSAQRFLSGRGIPFVSGYDSQTGRFVDISETINPDIVFMTHHYDWFAREFRIESFEDKIVYITPYSYFLDDNLKYNANTDAYFFAHKCFFETKDLGTLWRREAKNKKNKSSPFLGFLKIDDLLFSKTAVKDVWKIADKKVKRIIWAPHHLDAPLSNFLEYGDLFLELVKSRGDVQIAFRPHPGLMDSLRRVAKWTDERINAYWKQWSDLPNGFVSTGEFKDLFFTSDAMILDSISFIAEYLVTGKPSLVNDPKNKGFKFNAFAEKIKENLYRSSSWSEIKNFVDQVVVGGNDAMKSLREKLLRENFIPPNNQTAAENVYQEICAEIFKGAD